MRHAVVVPLHQLRETDIPEDLDGEDLLDAGVEAEKADGLAGLDVNDPHPARALAQPLDQRNATEHGALTDL